MNKKQGFTLIELLVVIAIIGILSSVVLASLNSARNKGSDVAIKSNLANSRAQAALFYDNNSQSYAGVCTVGTDNISGQLDSAAKQLSPSNTATANDFAYSAVGAANSAVCHDSATAWAAVVSLKNPNTASAGWCVDSTGRAQEATALASGVTACP